MSPVDAMSEDALPCGASWLSLSDTAGFRDGLYSLRRVTSWLRIVASRSSRGQGVQGGSPTALRPA